MTMARSAIHGARIEITFPEEQCFPLGIPDLIIQDEDDIPTVVRVKVPPQEKKPKHWLDFLFFGLMACFMLTETYLVLIR